MKIVELKNDYIGRKLASFYFPLFARKLLDPTTRRCEIAKCMPHIRGIQWAGSAIVGPAECDSPRLTSPLSIVPRRGYRGHAIYSVKRGIWQIAEKAAPVDAHEPHKCHRERINVGYQRTSDPAGCRLERGGERGRAKRMAEGWEPSSFRPTHPSPDRGRRESRAGIEFLINKPYICAEVRWRARCIRGLFGAAVPRWKKK